MASVANMRHHPALRAALDRADEHGDAVRIDRRTRWGNPFRLGADGTRADVVERYRACSSPRCGPTTLPAAGETVGRRHERHPRGGAVTRREFGRLPSIGAASSAARSRVARRPQPLFAAEKHAVTAVHQRQGFLDTPAHLRPHRAVGGPLLGHPGLPEEVDRDQAQALAGELAGERQEKLLVRDPDPSPVASFLVAAAAMGHRSAARRRCRPRPSSFSNQ